MAVGGDPTDEDAGPVAPKRVRKKAETLDKRDLLRRVVTASGVSARDVRRVSDALLAEIGAAIDTGASLSLAPLGKMRTVRTSEGTATDVHTLRLRRTPAKPPAEGGSGDESEVTPGTKAGARVKPGARGAASKGGAAESKRSVKPARASATRPKAVAADRPTPQEAIADADWEDDRDED